VKTNPSEYESIVKKLVEKTCEGRVRWEVEGSQFGAIRYLDAPESFRCELGSEGSDSFSFAVRTTDRDNAPSLSMMDQAGNMIFNITSNDLPTSPEEETISSMIEELYQLARRQALKVDQKLDLASSLLDRA
jgi:hypothetical protein